MNSWTSVRLGAALAATIAAASLTACSTSQPSSAPGTSSFATSVAVSVPRGPAARTAPGTTLNLGETAVLPANAFAAAGSTALYTVTGITPGQGVPDTSTRGGDAYFVYVTVTSLAAHNSPAPSVIGIAGSADGKTPALTLAPTVPLQACANPKPPATMKRGDSYATCLVAYADPGQKLSSVIYWADTTDADGFDFKSSPVVWGAPIATSSPASSAPAR